MIAIKRAGVDFFMRFDTGVLMDLLDGDTLIQLGLGKGIAMKSSNPPVLCHEAGQLQVVFHDKKTRLRGHNGECLHVIPVKRDRDVYVMLVRGKCDSAWLHTVLARQSYRAVSRKDAILQILKNIASNANELAQRAETLAHEAQKLYIAGNPRARDLARQSMMFVQRTINVVMYVTSYINKLGIRDMELRIAINQVEKKTTLLREKLERIFVI